MANITSIQLSNLFTNSKNPNLIKAYEDFILSLANKENLETNPNEEIKDVLDYIISKYSRLDIINLETCEVIYTINLCNYNGDSIPVIPLYDYVLSFGYPYDDGYSINGFFEAKTCHYKMNNVMIHKPSSNNFFYQYSCKKYAEMINDEGNVTDAFYSSGNDFNLYFLAKANRNEKFSVVLYDGSKRVNIVEVNIIIAGCKWSFQKIIDNSWLLANVKPI